MALLEIDEHHAPAPALHPARTNDLVHWQTTLLVDDVAELERRWRAAGGRFISAGTVSTPDAELGFVRSILVRDPDAHALHVVERASQGAAAR